MLLKGVSATVVLLTGLVLARPVSAQEAVPTFDALLAHKVALKPELVGVHPRVFVTRAGLETLRQRTQTTHKAEWTKVLSNLAALKGAPPPVPGPQERRSQNNVAFAIAEAALAYAVERKPEYLAAARQWTLAAIDYEPWGYTYNKPNTDLAAGHLLYAIGWAYDLLHDEFTAAERARIRTSLERHADLVYEAFSTQPGRRHVFTQNHDYIPTSGLAVTALALMGESKNAEKWAALARAHHHRANHLLSPDGYFFEGMEYWIFSTPWLIHFLDAWEHATGESLWDREMYRHWSTYLAHTLLPDGQTVVDFGDIWEGATTRARSGPDYQRAYPGGRLQSNFNVLYRVAARLKDRRAQAVAARYDGFRHSNLEEYMTLLWRDPSLQPAPMSEIPLAHHFKDSGVVFTRTSWNPDATAVAFKAGPPEGHRVTSLLPKIPEWRLDSGHAHPDAGSFVIWAHGQYLTGDTGYAGLPTAKNHNTMTFGGIGQGVEGQHDVWRKMDYAVLDRIRVREADFSGGRLRVVADLGAAYPPDAGVSRFTRTFTWDGASTFSVTDDLAMNPGRPAEWHLQSDTPFIEEGGRYRNGAAGGAGLSVIVQAPPGAVVTTGRATVKAPGPPGSIEKGPEEERGYRLQATAPGASALRFEVRFEILPPRGTR